MKTKAISTAFFSMFLMFSSLVASAQNAPTKNVPAPKEQVWFMPPGVVSELKPVKQFQEYLRDLHATNDCFQRNDMNSMGILIPGSDSYSVETSLVSTGSVTKSPAKLRIVLDHYVPAKIENPVGSGKWEDGFVATTFCGKKALTKKQVQVVVDRFIERVQAAANYDYRVLGALTEKSIAVLKERLGVGEEFEKNLDNAIPDYKGDRITYREYYYLPKPLTVSDFIPRELHLGYNVRLNGILGAAWLETGVVYYNPQAWIADELTGELPRVLAHEFVHASPLQRFPLADAFDIELGASIPEMLATEDQVDLFFHGYTNPLRKPIKVFFGFNFEQVRKEIIQFDEAGNLVIDEVAWNKYFGYLDQIKAVLLPFFADKALPEFYSDPWYWAAMNYRWNDKNAYIFVLMARHFNPVLLGGSKATIAWLDQNADALGYIGKKSWDSTGDNNSPNINMTVDMNVMVPPYLVNLYKQAIPEERRKALETYYREHPRELRALLLNRSKLMELVKSLQAGSLTLEKGGVR